MGLKVTHQAKPIGGVTVSQIPKELVDAMVAEWEFIQKNPDNEVVLSCDTAAEASQYYLYARAWGQGHQPRLEIRKLTARPRQPETEVRFSMKLYDENAKRPGRPAANAPAPAPEPAPAPAPVPETPATTTVKTANPSPATVKPREPVPAGSRK